MEPKARLDYLREELKRFDKEEKEIADLAQRQEKEQSELNKMEANLVTTPAGPAADALKDKIESVRKLVRKMNSDLASMRGNLARFGKKADIQKEIDQLQKTIDAKKPGEQ